MVKPRTSTATIRKIGSNGEVERFLGGASTAPDCGGLTLRSYPATFPVLPIDAAITLKALLTQWSG